MARSLEQRARITYFSDKDPLPGIEHLYDIVANSTLTCHRASRGPITDEEHAMLLYLKLRAISKRPREYSSEEFVEHAESPGCTRKVLMGPISSRSREKVRRALLQMNGVRGAEEGMRGGPTEFLIIDADAPAAKVLAESLQYIRIRKAKEDEEGAAVDLVVVDAVERDDTYVVDMGRICGMTLPFGLRQRLVVSKEATPVLQMAGLYGREPVSPRELEAEILGELSVYGGVAEVHIPAKPGGTLVGRGCVYVLCKSASAAEKVFQEISGQMFRGRFVFLSYFPLVNYLAGAFAGA